MVETDSTTTEGVAHAGEPDIQLLDRGTDFDSGSRRLRTIKENIRQADVVARLGGDEFALLLPETGEQPAKAVIDKVWEKLRVTIQSQWPVTFSIGMITFTAPPPTVDDLVRLVDDVMYEVKHGGKNMLHHRVEGDG